MMKRLCQLAVVIMALLAMPALAQFNIPAGSSAATIQSTINSAAAAGTSSTVNFAPGNYSITSQINVPCPLHPMTIQGPVPAVLGTTWPLTYTATLTSSVGNSWAFSGQACANGTAFRYLNYDGGQPSGGGGGFLFVNPGMNNLSVTYMFFHGVSAIQTTQQQSDTFIYMGRGNISDAHIQNAIIQWNRFGFTGSGDCGGQANVGNQGLMDLYGGNNACSASNFAPPSGSTHCNYQGDIDLTHAGGSCGGVGINNNFDSLTIKNNTFADLEQPLKFYEAPNPSNWASSNLLVQYNDLSGHHRIGGEAQSSAKSSGPNYLWDSNDIHDLIKPSAGTWGLSLPLNTTDSSNNVLIGNTPTTNDKNGAGAGWAGDGLEFWGGGTTKNNLIQGLWNGGILWGFMASSSAILNNTIQGPNMNSPFSICSRSYPNRFIEDEECSATLPTISGNVTSPTVTAVTSIAPNISPAAGPQAFPLTVTLHDAGYTSGSVPLGNTGIWYTTDGSTPVPGSGTAKRLDDGGTFQINSCSGTCTVKAVGMWGALNQPAGYPSGYGFVPSSVVTSTFTSSGLFISPTGNDANPGTSSSPWLTPNHAMTCGQVITALPGTYSAANFNVGKWGTVSCPAANNVAWLQCQTFDTCKISSSSTDGMWVDKSFWGVQGWEATVTGGTNGACFHAGPSGASSIHHIIFANNVANVCRGGGFNSYALGSASVDYIAYLGNVAYNASGGTGACYSGFNIYKPIASDAASGTHMYVAGNFSYSNIDGHPCSGGLVTDGEGFNLDTFDWSQAPTGAAYTQQAVVQNNISLANGSSGFLMENNKVGGSAPTFFKNNTSYGNLADSGRSFCTGLGELYAQAAFNVTMTGNIAATNAATGCSGAAIYALSVADSNNTVTAAGNWLYSAAGNNIFTSANSPAFVPGSNNTGASPAFASTVIPGAPSCTGKSRVPDCVATLIANFTPTVTAAQAYGYQTPSSTPVADPLYPQWLCNVSLPAGLVTSGCGASTPAATPVLTPGTESFYNTVSVSVSTTTPGATIYYTTNGTTPTTASPVYSAPITVTSTTTIQAMAAAPGFTNSSIGSGTYTLNIPPLTGCSQQNAGSVNTLIVGATAQQFAQCSYLASGETLTCSPGADRYGNVATVWGVAGPQISIGAIGSASPGLVTGVSATSGTPVNSTLFVGLHNCSPWGWNVNLAPPTPLSVYITGASSLVVPNTTQLAAKCHYASGPDQDCTVTDIYGDGVTSWASSDPTKATIQNVGQTSPGQVAAVAPGTPSMTATIGPRTLTSAPFPITVTNPAVTLTGVSLSTTGGVTGLFVGSTNQLRATCTYSDMSSLDCTNTDAHGTKAGTYVSTTPSHATVGSTTGLVTGVAPGTTTFTAHAGAFTSLALPLTVLSVPSGVYTITISGPVNFSGTVRF